MSRPKIRKATRAEKIAYNKTKPSYPLYGFATIDGHQCVIEDLRGEWSAPDPTYEVLAPSGFHFGLGEGSHALLCTNLRDVLDRCTGMELEPCDESCGV